MRVVKNRINKDGHCEVTVVLHKNEQLIAIDEGEYYRMGGQVEDVFRGHILTEAKRVVWCSVGQQWEKV